ncbi:MAG TPA: PTS sugar transporter subunit IIC [bacterium]|nr:PTS sugar transporter subunit IIC [bacterium]HPN45844.1 PTS sugar transporter subunit IIC [bacterium]
MWLQVLAASVWSGFVAMDTTAALQIMISRPVISCSVTGLLLGNFKLGFMVGILLELFWVHELPIGAAPFSEGNVGASSASAIAIISYNLTGREYPSLVFALVLAVFIGIIGGYMVELMRKINSRLFTNLLNDKELTMSRISKAHFAGIGMAFLLGFLLSGSSIWLFGFTILPATISLIPAGFDHYIQPFSNIFLGAGCGILIFMFLKNNKKWWLIFIGLGVGLLLN